MGGEGRMKAITWTVERIDLDHEQVGLSANEHLCWVLRKRTNSRDSIVSFFYKCLKIHAYLYLYLIRIGS